MGIGKIEKHGWCNGVIPESCIICWKIDCRVENFQVKILKMVV